MFILISYSKRQRSCCSLSSNIPFLLLLWEIVMRSNHFSSHKILSLQIDYYIVVGNIRIFASRHCCRLLLFGLWNYSLEVLNLKGFQNGCVWMIEREREYVVNGIVYASFWLREVDFSGKRVRVPFTAPSLSLSFLFFSLCVRVCVVWHSVSWM